MKYIQLSGACELPDISCFGKFKSIVVVEEKVSDVRQNEISKWLVDSGCMYMMAWGIDSSSWDDSVDWANIEQFDYAPIPEESSVITTWHEDESLSEVFWFSKFCASHEHHELNLIVLHISSANKEDEFKSICDATG